MYLIHLEKTAWQLLGNDNDDDETKESPRGTFAADDLTDQARLISESLVASGYEGEPLVLGLAANWCLTATIEVTSPQMLRKPQLLHHQLEEWIPWSAEEYVSDFLGHRSQAFGVAVRHRGLAEFLQDLETQGVLIVAIVPTTFLAVTEHLFAESIPAEHRLLWAADEEVDVVTIRQGQPWQWKRVPSPEVTREMELDELTQANAMKTYTRGLSVNLNDAIELPATTQLEAARLTSTAIITGQQEPLLNLRKNELAGAQRHQVLGKELRRLKVALTILLICTAMGLWIRSGQYQQTATQLRAKLATVHEELFPNVEVPGRVGPAIEKEFQLLRGTRSPNRDLPNPAAADAVLQKVLTSLPEGMRFRLPELRVEQDRVTLGGEVRSNADADRLATSLRSHGFSVDPPRTQRLADKGFSVRLNGRVESTNTTAGSAK